MARTRNGRSGVLLLLAMMSACGEPDTTAAADAHAGKIVTAPSSDSNTACAGSAARLTVTRLCPVAAEALLVDAPGAAATPPPGCGWTIGETLLTDGLAVLYRAARCQSRTTKLAFVPSEPMGAFTVAASPYEGTYDAGEPIIRMAKAADKDAILALARRSIHNPGEAARCQLRSAAIDGWPADALVIDEVPQPRSDEVRSACGDLGLDEDAQTFWRLSQGVGWFFQLGQDSPIVDAGSFTLIQRSAGGSWRRSER